MPIPEQKLPWLTSPLRSSVGTLRLAGALVGTPGIRSDSMRILGNYALVLLTAGKGYYLDANDRSADLEPGDAILVFPELAHAYGPARYLPDSNTSMWLRMHVHKICQRIAGDREAYLAKRVAKPPRHIKDKEAPSPDSEDPSSEQNTLDLD